MLIKCIQVARGNDFMGCHLLLRHLIYILDWTPHYFFLSLMNDIWKSLRSNNEEFLKHQFHFDDKRKHQNLGIKLSETNFESMHSNTICVNNKNTRTNWLGQTQSTSSHVTAGQVGPRPSSFTFQPHRTQGEGSVLLLSNRRNDTAQLRRNILPICGFIGCNVPWALLLGDEKQVRNWTSKQINYHWKIATWCSASYFSVSIWVNREVAMASPSHSSLIPVIPCPV